MLKRCVTEAIGTACLVFAGTGAIIINEVSGGAIGHVGIALTFGMVVAAMIYSTGHISGAHINPAVTLGFAITKNFPWKEVPYYWVSQIIGAVLASGALSLMFGTIGNMGATVPYGSDIQSLALEIILTFILMFVIMAMATDIRSVGGAAAVAIGMTVALEAMFAGPISGASMNPARSFGPALLSSEWASHWLYWVGPMAGASIGATVYHWLKKE
ncbi:MAG: MIP family channel protein [Dehalococcoidia bacterium]|nr:MIP family channel protein [Dehalococcoidia bacterium]